MSAAKLFAAIRVRKPENMVSYLLGKSQDEFSNSNRFITFVNVNRIKG